MRVETRVDEIKAGDSFLLHGIVQWTADEDAHINHGVGVKVTMPDGSKSLRFWDDPEITIAVHRRGSH